MNAERKQLLHILAALGVTALSLYLALRGIDLREVVQALRRITWSWFALSIALHLVTLGIRAQRWRLLLDRRISLGDSFGLMVIGYLVSNVLPLRAGDPTRAFAASLRGPVSALAALSTVVVERVLDMALIVIILLGTLPFVPGLQTYLVQGQTGTPLSFNLILLLSGSLALGMLVSFILIALYPRRVEALALHILKALRLPQPERWLRPLRKVMDGFAALGSPRSALTILLWSLLLWVTTIGYFLAAMLACADFIPHPTWLQSTVATWASAFGMVFPATGGIGSFHFAVREALYWGFDIARDWGFTYAVVVHAVSYLDNVILGAATMMLWGLSLKGVVRRKLE